MPKYTVVLTQTTAISIEAPSAEVLDAALDDETLFGSLLEYIYDPDNWELAADVKEGVPEAPAELALVDGVLLVLGPGADPPKAS